MKLRTVLITAAIAAMGASAFAQSTMDSSPKPAMPSPAAAPATTAMPKTMPAEKHKAAKAPHKKHVAKKATHKQKAMPTEQKAAG
ncbi:hypothetical protein [Hydrogenophaga sp.]|jgi:hypothetical protein|uniref:hypothetical protein n=2 Tax=Hydrogenophaga TaxID=47420 RepID=UPI004037061D